MDHYTRSARNTFSGLVLNRKPLCLEAGVWEACLLSAQAAYVVVHQDEIFFDSETAMPRLLTAQEVADWSDIPARALLLGEDATHTYFAINVEHLDEKARESMQPWGRFEKLRQFSAILPPDMASLLGYARSAVDWNSKVKFCALCGHTTTARAGSLAQICTNPACGREHYPRVDPAVIVLVHHGDCCLLGRQTSWRPKVYSAIAGYVEPGESVEDAVLRELLEETGIRISNIRYRSSQPWPFSGSLMLGFHAQAENVDIHLNDQELEDARWFARQDLPGLLDSGVLALPGEESIARQLFDEWYLQRDV